MMSWCWCRRWFREGPRAGDAVEVDVDLNGAGYAGRGLADDDLDRAVRGSEGELSHGRVGGVVEREGSLGRGEARSLVADVSRLAVKLVEWILLTS